MYTNVVVIVVPQRSPLAWQDEDEASDEEDIEVMEIIPSANFTHDDGDTTSLPSSV